MKVNPTEKGTEKFMMLKIKTCPGLYEDILKSCKVLSSKNELSLFFSVVMPKNVGKELTPLGEIKASSYVWASDGWYCENEVEFVREILYATCTKSKLSQR